MSMERIRLTKKRKGPDPKSNKKLRTLTPDMITKFCNLIRRGLPVDATCDYLGIYTTTYYAWLQDGTNYLEHGGTGDKAMAGEFVRQFRKATAVYRLNLINSLHEKRNGMWTRDLAVLERRDRRNFSKWEQQGGGDEAVDPDESFL